MISFQDTTDKMKSSACKLEAILREKDRELVKAKRESDSLALQLHEVSSKSLIENAQMQELEGSFSQLRAQMVRLESEMQVKKREVYR